jgi:ribosomal protein S12 methylthiotransferase
LTDRAVSPHRSLKVAFHTLGCPKNIVDSNTCATVLRGAGIECVTQPHRADVLIINTCGFLDDAKVEATEVMLEAVRWKMAKAGRRVLVMGCLTQRDGAEVAESLPELDGVFGIGEWTRMLETLGANPVTVSSAVGAAAFHSGPAGPGSAYLQISDGCSHQCSFCSIPQMRGLYRSEPMEELVAEAGTLVAGGVRELILIGQETTSYGVDLYRERRIVELCEHISDLPGLHWIRILYAHPPTINPRLMEQLAGVAKLAPYIDFPIEHASDRMLTLMNRRTTAVRMKECIDAFRSALPNAAVRTSVLVGFPGETDEDFADLHAFMEEVRFERAGVFVYSPQEHTRGAELPDPVEEGIALDRLDQLMRLQKKISLEKHQSLVGRSMGVLIERNTRGASFGRGPWDAPEIDGVVRVAGLLPPGEIVDVLICGARAYQLDGKPTAASRENSLRESCGNIASPAH